MYYINSGLSIFFAKNAIIHLFRHHFVKFKQLLLKSLKIHIKKNKSHCIQICININFLKNMQFSDFHISIFKLKMKRTLGREAVKEMYPFIKVWIEISSRMIALTIIYICIGLANMVQCSCPRETNLIRRYYKMCNLFNNIFNCGSSDSDCGIWQVLCQIFGIGC